MTETPGNPGSGDQNWGAPPPPPPAGGFNEPPAYQPPPAAPPQQPDYQQPGYQQPPAYQPPPAPGFDQPTQQGGFAAGAANVGQQFQNFDPKSLQNFDPKSVNPLDWGIIAAGVLSLIPFSFFGYFKYSVSFGGASDSKTFSAWHGFFSWFGILVAFIAALILAAELIAKIKFPFPSRLVVLGGMALGLLCTILALFIVPGVDGADSAAAFGVKLDKGHGFSYWLILILMIVGTGLAFRRFTDTGGKLPSRS